MQKSDDLRASISAVVLLSVPGISATHAATTATTTSAAPGTTTWPPASAAAAGTAQLSVPNLRYVSPMGSSISEMALSALPEIHLSMFCCMVALVVIYD